jgi:hypothetical protein
MTTKVSLLDPFSKGMRLDLIYFLIVNRAHDMLFVLICFLKLTQTTKFF